MRKPAATRNSSVILVLLVTTSVGGATNPFLFKGTTYDPEIGSYQNRARQYHPALKRFMQRDPIKSGSNHYAAFSGNPLLTGDPSGLRSDDSNFVTGVTGRNTAPLCSPQTTQYRGETHIYGQIVCKGPLCKETSDLFDDVTGSPGWQLTLQLWCAEMNCNTQWCTEVCDYVVEYRDVNCSGDTYPQTCHVDLKVKQRRSCKDRRHMVGGFITEPEVVVVPEVEDDPTPGFDPKWGISVTPGKLSEDDPFDPGGWSDGGGFDPGSDSDGDGVPDLLDSAPNDPCIPNPKSPACVRTDPPFTIIPEGGVDIPGVPGLDDLFPGSGLEDSRDFLDVDRSVVQ